MASIGLRSLILLLGVLVVPAQAATFVVTVSHDNASDCSGGGSCTLRGALAAAAANPGLDRIEFALAQNAVIAPLTPFPTIGHQVVIDARPSPDYDGNPWVYLDGAATADASGLRFGNGGGGSAVYGIGFTRWDDAGIELGGSAHLVSIDGCAFGRTNIGGVAGNGTGISVLTDGNTIGQRYVSGVGFDGAGNLVWGSAGDGIQIGGDGNLVYGNTIGGTLASQGNNVGIRLFLANNNIIGGVGAGQRSSNLVGRSTGAGILVNGNGNSIRANYIGTTGADGQRPNGGAGIEVSGTGNVIGGSGVDLRNQIAYNEVGILLGGIAPASQTSVLGNHVRANRGSGIRIQSGSENVVEGASIFGNGTGGVGDGIRIDGDLNIVRGNRIGLEGGNAGEGVFLSGSAGQNSIEGNLIGFNQVGVKAEGTGNRITGNRIGWTAGGAEFGNSEQGVVARFGATATRIEDNDIGANGDAGVVVEGGSVLVCGNNIGGALPSGSSYPQGPGNGSHGVQMGGADGTLGGTDCAPNTIAFNDAFGVIVADPRNAVVGNLIALNYGSGVGLAGVGAHDNEVSDNGIWGNGEAGITVFADAGDGNRLLRNTMDENVSPGIDLLRDGPTANDAGDADEGPNRLQNTPVIHFISQLAGTSSVEVGYSVDSTLANASYPLRIEVFYSLSPGASEGIEFLGAGTYAAPGVDTLVVPVPDNKGGGGLVATATDADGNTSEFSLAMEYVLDPVLVESVFADGFED